ncbi:Ribosomal protein S18 acetylase RimI [Halomicrobium zhouii]|uniref:Ribosomal protein S18 acetylase RimI n=1 Tax=Halomicrobium zhouii TaxID=767519 RepID=A0A1I6KMC3_9EURY|nr:GNAT family N-acetyltransferase [Halomicrobium zhouii]SFR92412.1 Ribosomal protein S18 acetylase RimI [Halomicrobium zhouii]
MELVEATAEDVDVLAAYWFSLASEMEQYSTLNELAVEGPADVESGFEELLDGDDTTPFLLDVDGTTVGYLLLRRDEHPTRELSEYATIVDLFVEESHRDQGLGSEAIDAAKRVAAERGADYLTVSCEWGNDGARRFYETNGFTAKQVTYAQELETTARGDDG